MKNEIAAKTNLRELIFKEFTKATKKMAALDKRILDRQNKSKTDFPNQNVIEVETIDDELEMNSLEGELAAYDKILKILEKK